MQLTSISINLTAADCLPPSLLVISWLSIYPHCSSESHFGDVDTEAGEEHPTQASMSWASQPLWPHLLSTGRCGNCGVRDKQPKGFQERWQRAEGVGERARKTDLSWLNKCSNSLVQQGNPCLGCWPRGALEVHPVQVTEPGGTQL